MAEVSISEAARLTGKGRATIQRHIKSGKLSVGKDATGNPVIDTAELFRVYRLNQAKQAKQAHETTGQAVKQEPAAVEALREQLKAAQEREEWLKRQLEIERERNQKQLEAAQTRITELEQRMLPPAQERKGFFARLFGG